MNDNLTKFWSKVTKSPNPEHDNGCWLWNAFKKPPKKPRYGNFSVKENGKNKTYPAHRWIYIQLNGQIPEEIFVCHSCDNPPCVRPNHLFLSTSQGNSEDMARKGRMRPTPKLAPDLVKEIRISTLSIEKLADKYQVSKTCIREAQRGVKWAWVDSIGKPNIRHTGRKISKKISDKNTEKQDRLLEQRLFLLKLRGTFQFTQKQLADILQIKVTQLQRYECKAGPDKSLMPEYIKARLKAFLDSPKALSCLSFQK